MNFPNKFSMIGDTNRNGFQLRTEKLVGNVYGAIGFIKQNNNDFYIPNTLLNCDIRQYTDETYQVKAIYKKHKTSDKYSNEPLYLSKDLKELNNDIVWNNQELKNKLI